MQAPVWLLLRALIWPLAFAAMDAAGAAAPPLLSINSLARPRTEPDNAQSQHCEDSNIKQCINHLSLH
jgi:hypothetical protein